MGKTFVSMKQNHMDEQMRKVFNKLKNKEVVGASDVECFNKIPPFSKLVDIDLGCDGTKQNVFRFKDEKFVVFDSNVDESRLAIAKLRKDSKFKE